MRKNNCSKMYFVEPRMEEFVKGWIKSWAPVYINNPFYHVDSIDTFIFIIIIIFFFFFVTEGKRTRWQIVSKLQRNFCMFC